MKKLPIQSPAGLASLFPGLAKDPAPSVRIKLQPGFMEAAGGQLKAGDKFTIAGYKLDKSARGGFITNCKPGEETVLVLGDGYVSQ